MGKLNRKGFTLVELLVTIVKLALVVGFSTYGIITVVNNSKNQSIAISNQSIKDAARIYSGEASYDSWKEVDGYDDKYFCVTVMELVNKGLLQDKDVSSKIDTSTYVAVSKNKITEVIKKEEILTDSNSDIYQICTGIIKNENEEILKKPEITSASSYTDQITFNFNEGEATYAGESSVDGYECKYGTTSGNLYKYGTVDENNGTCTLDGLKNNTNYYVTIFMKTQNGSYISSDNYVYSTKDFIVPNISVDYNKKEVKIEYDNANIRNNSKLFYFTSSDNAIANGSYKVWNESSSSFLGTIGNNIDGNYWYKSNDSSGNNKEIIVLTYDENISPNIVARVYDDSNNYISNESSYSFIIDTVTYNIKFYRNGANSINGSTDEFINLSCIAKVGESCSITSPSIIREGYDIIGWSKSSDATSSEWNANTSKNINSDSTYYAITIPKEYTVSYNGNGGINVPSNQTKTYGVDLILSDVIPKRDGYTFVGWNTKEDGSGVNYYSNGTYNENSNLTLYAKWRVNKVIIRYNSNGASNISESNYGGKWSIVGDFVYLNGKEFNTYINYNSETSENGLSDYNNKDYMNIIRNDYATIFDKEWICLDGGCKDEIYSQSSKYNAGDFCDAINGDCTVTLGVNWFKTNINGVRYDQKTKEGYTAVYNITNCPDMNYCYYSLLNGISYNSNNTNVFDNDIIVPFANGIDKSYSNRPNLSNSLTGGESLYITATDGLNCRYGASTDTDIKYAFGCGTELHVYKTTMATSSDKSQWWYYYESGNCYLHGGSLSKTAVSCASGSGSGPSCVDEINPYLIIGSNNNYYCCETNVLDESLCIEYRY